MALITRLSSAFTDTTLPILQKDPVLPAAGGVFLLDGKNPGSWSGGSTIGVADPLKSLSRTAAADGTNPGQGYWTSGVTPQDLSPISKPLAYDSATGRITLPSAVSPAARFVESQAQGRYLFNALDSFCISTWVYVAPPEPPATVGPSLLVLTLQPSGNDNARNGLIMTCAVGAGGAAGAGGFQASRPARIGYPVSPGVVAATRTDNFIYGGASNQPAALTAGIHRLGAAWYRKNDNNWYQRPILDQVLGAELATPSHVTTGLDLGQTTAGGARDPFWVAAIGGRATSNTFGTPNALYRLYIENLTLSGRTPEEVWAADWARGNGRYS